MKIIDHWLLAEFRAAYRCEMCRRPTLNGCDPHHAFYTRGACHLDIRINLIALCRRCHDLAGHLVMAKLACQEIIAKREGTTIPAIWNELWRLANLRKWMVIERDE